MQAANNYSYDATGNLIADAHEEIEEIRWNVQGKVVYLKRTESSNKPDIEFEYDAMGNRIAKHVKPKNSATHSTYYVRDAQGNTMATYTNAQTNGTETITLEEQPIYGSSRIGVYSPTADTGIVRGLRTYEATNHLGNVLTTFTDRIILSEDFTYTPEQTSATDYYPFGMPMPSRSFSVGNYRYGFGSHEKDDEIFGGGNIVDMGDRWLDVRLGRTQKPDAKGGKYPFISPYVYALNNPIIYNDPDGKDVYLVIYTTKAGDVGHATIAVENYKKVETKVIENGQEITKTEWVKDGTLTYYELGPASSLNGPKDAFKNVKALYGEFNVTLDNVINDPISRYESSAPDGIIKFETSVEIDLVIHDKLKSKTNEPYNATGNNCSDYAGCGTDIASSDGKVKRKEFLIFPIRSSTPNKLFQNAQKASNATVIQDAGEQANKKFRKAYKNSVESLTPSTPVTDEE